MLLAWLFKVLYSKVQYKKFYKVKKGQEITGKRGCSEVMVSKIILVGWSTASYFFWVHHNPHVRGTNSYLPCPDQWISWILWTEKNVRTVWAQEEWAALQKGDTSSFLQSTWRNPVKCHHFRCQERSPAKPREVCLCGRDWRSKASVHVWTCRTGQKNSCLCNIEVEKWSSQAMQH